MEIARQTRITHKIKQHNFLSKNYNSSQKINGKIPFRCKKNIQSTTKTSAKEIHSSQLPHVVPGHSRFISGTEIQIKPCSVILKRINVETKHEENKEVPQYPSVFKYKTLCSKSSRTLRSKSSRTRSQSSRTLLSQTSSELNIKSRKNYVSPQPKAPIRRTSYGNEHHTLVKKEIEFKHSRNFPASFHKQPSQKTNRISSSSVSLNQFTNFTENTPIDDIYLSFLSERSVSKKRNDIPIKQKSKHLNKNSFLFHYEITPKSTCKYAPSKRRKNDHGALNISIDDISLRRFSQSVIALSDITSPRQKHTLVKKRVQNNIQKSKHRKSTTHKTPVVEKTKKQRKPRLKKQIVLNQAQSQKRTSSKRRKKVSSSNRPAFQVQSNNSLENVPIDDLALAPREPKPKTFRFTKKGLKRKRIAIDALKKADAHYQDDLYEEKKFDKFEELFVDTSLCPVPSCMLTPKLGFLVTPMMSQESPKFVDCFSLSDYERYRRIAEECMLINATNKTTDILSTVSICSF